MIKVIINIEKYATKKRLSLTECQMLEELDNNGFIVVEQSEVNENLFYYFKTLKSGKKSIIHVTFTRNEIQILDNYQALTEKAKTLEMKIGGSVDTLKYMNNINDISEIVNDMDLMTSMDFEVKVNGVKYYVEMEVQFDHETILFIWNSKEDYEYKYGKWEGGEN